MQVIIENFKKKTSNISNELPPPLLSHTLFLLLRWYLYLDNS